MPVPSRAPGRSPPDVWLFFTLLFFAAPDSLERKFARIETGLVPGTRIGMSPAEWNAWAAANAPDSITKPHLEFGHNTVTATGLLEGTKPLTVVARVESENGRVRITLTRVQVAGASLKGRVLDFFTGQLIRNSYPDTKINQWFPLPNRIDRIEIEPRSAVVIIGPTPPPLAWRSVIGEYPGVTILERDGKLFERRGTVEREITPAETPARFAPAGATFRVRPLRPIPELTVEALRAVPPPSTGDRPPDLIQPARLDPSIHLDIRYATTNNFLSTPVYPGARAYLQRPAAEAIARVSRAIRADGFGILIHDAYRPWYITKIFWDAVPEYDHKFVADPATGSRHNRGCAVDLTLYHRATGKAVEMPGTYDEMTPRSYPDYPGGTAHTRWMRDYLRKAMEAEGFTVNEYEWWHFDYKDWPHYAVSNWRWGHK